MWKELAIFEVMASLILAFQTFVICEVIETGLTLGWTKAVFFRTWDDVVFGGFYMLVAAFVPATVFSMLLFAHSMRKV